MILTYEAIAKRAFEIWEREGRPGGRDQQHWFLAERELRQETVEEQEVRGVLSNDPDLLRPPAPAMDIPRKRGVRPAQTKGAVRPRV